MTQADLDALAAALEAERARWAERLTARVAREVADAHAHASMALTDTLRRTEDGRPTIRRANRSPSYLAAVGHLEALWTWLAGPSAVSLDGAVRDAREAFYRLAFRLHAPFIPAEFLIRADPEPTAKGVALVRGAALHGYDPRRELGPPILGAIGRLSAAVSLAAGRATTGKDAAELLKAWETREVRAIGLAVLSLLSDSVEHANTEAMGDLVHHDFRASGTITSEE